MLDPTLYSLTRPIRQIADTFADLSQAYASPTTRRAQEHCTFLRVLTDVLYRPWQ